MEKRAHSASFALTLLATLCLWPTVGCGQDPEPELASPEPQAEPIRQAPSELGPPDEPLIERARGIFDRIRTVYPEVSNPKLRVLPVAPDPFAWATRDGEIVLSLGALRLCLVDAPQPKGDTWLAFVLSHETAHLARRHFLHLRVREAVQKAPGTPLQQLSLGRGLFEEAPARELEADQQGLIQLALAGFDPLLLLEDDSRFFKRWVGQSAGALAFADRSPEQRMQFLQGVVRQVADELPYFEMGTRFYQLGRYKEALTLLEHFDRAFPGPAILNNLGLCHYQLAAQRLANCDGRMALRFKLPTMLASETLAERFVARGPGSACYDDPQFRQHVREAANYFRRIQDRWKNYLPSRVNHLSLMLLSGEGVGVLARAIEISEANHIGEPLELLQLLGIYLRGYGTRFDQSETCIEEMRKLAAADPESAEIAFDLARILLESQRAGEAEKEWRRFLALEPHGPYADYVRQQYRIPPPRPAQHAAPPASPAPLGPVGAETASWLSSLSDPVYLRAGPVEARVYRNGSLVALVMEGSLLLVDQKLAGGVAADVILERHGAPLSRLSATAGEFLGYDGFGFDLVRGQAVRRIYF